MSIMTFFLTRLWKPCTGTMEQLWGFSFQSNQANSPVRATDSIILVNHQSTVITEIFASVWQDLQILAMYHTSSLVSILFSTSAQTHSITRRSTQKQQVGSSGLLGLDEIESNDSFQLPITYLFSLVFLFSFFLGGVPGAEKAQSFTLRTAKALAMTAVDVVCNPDLLMQVREDFRLAKLKMEGTGDAS